MKLIGITGLAGSGKDEFAGELVKHGWIRYSFADPLKDGLAAMLKVPREWMDNRESKDSILHPYGVTTRHMMQSLGKEWGRKMVHPEIWIMLASQFVAEASLDGSGVVISDVCFPNEAAFIREKGGTLAHIWRDESGLKGAARQHESENPLVFEFGDIEIHNDGTLENLKAKARGLALVSEALVQ